MVFKIVQNVPIGDSTGQMYFNFCPERFGYFESFYNHIVIPYAIIDRSRDDHPQRLILVHYGTTVPTIGAAGKRNYNVSNLP